MQSNQSPKKKAIFLRSNSSDALVEATNEIRRKHSRLLRTEKRETKKEARSFYALFINHDEETESNSASMNVTLVNTEAKYSYLKYCMKRTM